MPVGLSSHEMDRLEEVIKIRKRVEKGQNLFQSGSNFQGLFAVRFGFFKTTTMAADGREQVTGFQMAGDLLGMDGIVNSKHTCDAIALEDAEVCVMPYDQLNDLSHDFPALQKHVHRVMSREIVHDHGVMMMLGSMRAEERLAAFLVSLAERMSSRGFSARELMLRMTREEIGSYLGMKLETVSRTFSRFVEDGIIQVKQRHIVILDEAKLRSLAVSEPL